MNKLIHINNINIKFKDTVIEQGDVSLQEHQITLFTGASGCGKSSLLNILGLLDETNKYQYLWDHHEIKRDEYERLKQYNISYVFQNYGIIGDLDIEDNFKAMFQIAGLPFHKERMKELLNEVSLASLSLKQKAKSLSGGEKQRLAIALALVKEPKLLLLDEPTANLDERNSEIIVQILHQLKRKNIMIVIATHHKNRYHADHIYEIKEKQIVEIMTTEAVKEEIHHETEGRKKFPYFSYAKLHFVSHFLIYAILLIAMIFSFYEVSKGLVNVAATKHFMDESLGSIVDDEIFVNNIEKVIDENDKYFHQVYLHPFSKEKISELSTIPHIKNIYPYTVLLDTSYATLEDDGAIKMRIDRDGEIDPIFNEVAYKGNKINTMKEFSNSLIFASCDSDAKKRNSIKIDEKVEHGVFISKELADKLQINDLNNTEIEVYMPIHMGYSTSEGGTGDGSVTVETRPLAALYSKTKLAVQGIYEKDMMTNGYYDIGGDEKIFIDYRMIKKYHDEIIQDKELMKQYHEVYTENFFEGDDFYVNDTSSTYIIQVDDPKYTEEVSEQIYKTLDHVYVKNKATEKDTLYASLRETAMLSLLMPTILFVVTAILMMILYLYTLHARKKEIAYLQANGIRKTYRIPFLNQLMIIIPAGIIGYCMAYVWAYNYGFDVLRQVMLLDVIAILMLMILCYFISYRYFKHLDVRKELHSN